MTRSAFPWLLSIGEFPSTTPASRRFCRWPRGCSRRAEREGFTLVEMLVVMAVIGVLLALALPAVTSLNKSGSLNSAGRLIVNLLTVARSEAIARRTVVRLEVATAWPDPAYNYRKAALTAATLNDAGTAYTYRQIGNWETIPNGVVFEVNDPLQNTLPADGSVYLFAGAGAAPLGDAGSLAFGGTVVPTVYVAFSSTGGLIERQAPAGVPVPVRARLVEGTVSGPASINYTRRTGGGAGGYPTANWLDVRVNNLFGRIEVGRPDFPLP